MCVSIKIDIMGKSLNYFSEALNYDSTKKLVIDASLHRFEYSVDLSWMALKSCLLQEGIKVFTPRECLHQAFLANWINDDVCWLRMLQDHTLASSSYDFGVAIEIYRRLSMHYCAMKQLHEFLSKRFLCF